jgi:hypothetical protein
MTVGTPATVDMIGGLAAGQYSVTVTDLFTGCMAVDTANVGIANAVNLCAGNGAGASGAMISIPVTVDNFQNIAGFNFTLTLANPAVATITGVSAINPIIASVLIGPGFPTSTVTAAWSTGVPPPAQPPGTILFNVDMTLTGVLGQMTTLDFSAVSMTNGALNPVPVKAKSGSVTSSAAGTQNVSGVIHTPLNALKGVANVTVDRNPGASTSTAAGTGAYSFAVTSGTAVTIDPFELTDADNGWTTGMDIVDAVLIKQYLGVLTVLDECQFIAADVDGDDDIDINDALFIEQFLALLRMDVATNDSWRFVPDDFVLAPVPNTLTAGFPETRTYPNVIAAITTANFKAVKIGDVSGTIESLASVSALTSDDDDSDSRSANVVIQLKDQNMRQGEVRDLEFDISQAGTLFGLRWTLEVDQDAVEIVSVDSDVLTAFDQAAVGYNSGNNDQVAMVWTDAIGVGTDLSKILKVRVKARKDVHTLNDIVSINSDYVNGEVVMDDLTTRGVDFELVDPIDEIDIVDNSFELMGNKPNPFDESTIIPFVLPEKAEVDFSIYDVNGKRIYNINQEFDRGYNEIEISAEELKHEGIFYYNLNTSEHSATRKMIRLK